MAVPVILSGCSAHLGSNQRADALTPPSGWPHAQDHASWATEAAQDMETTFVCNVTVLPEEQAISHPVLDHPEGLLLTPGTHLLLYGSSHVRSVRSLLVSAAKAMGQHVNTTLVSRSDDCDTSAPGSSGPENFPGDPSFTECGIFPRPCGQADLTVDGLNGGSSTITSITNHAGFQLVNHVDALDSLLRAAEPPFTHGYYYPAHDPEYFDAQCATLRSGVPPDRNTVGDRAERFCDMASATCRASMTMLQTILRHVPTLGYLGGISLRAYANTSVARLHDSYRGLLENRTAPWCPEDTACVVENGHACNAICADDGRGGRTCVPGEGAAIAWEVLRSAGLPLEVTPGSPDLDPGLAPLSPANLNFLVRT